MTPLVLLLLAAPLPFPVPLSDLERVQGARYAQVLHPAIGENRKLMRWLWFADPRPDAEFRTFSGERLGAFALFHSAGWSQEFFRDAVNPHTAGVKPVGYHLSREQHTLSLLLFEWDAAGYSFSMQESRSAALLRVRPGRVRFSPKDGIPAVMMASILGDVLGAKVATRGDLRKQFRLPDVLRPGEFVTNADPKWVGTPVIDGWEESVLVFVTSEHLCVLLFKANGGRQAGYFGLEEESWLPGLLVTKDGESLLINALRGRPSGRGLPKETITLPKP